MRHRADIDRCGWGTEWGCKAHLPGDGTQGKLIMNGRVPVDHRDNGHVMFHVECFDKLEPGLTRPSPRRLRLVPPTQGDSHVRHSIGA